MMAGIEMKEMLLVDNLDINIREWIFIKKEQDKFGWMIYHAED